MPKLTKFLTHGDVSEDFYIRNKKQLLQRNVNMLKIGFTVATVLNIALYFFTSTNEVFIELGQFYGLFSIWFLVWEILTFTILIKHQKYAKFFYAIFGGSVLTLAAFTGSLFSKDMVAVVYFIFLIFIPGLYVNKPTCCITTTILSGLIFCFMVMHFKTDSYIIYIDIVNTIFAMIIGIIFNIYNINIQLVNIQSSVILKEQSNMDELTTLPNRRSFNKHVIGYFEEETNNDIGIIMMDVDFFKPYNDTYGHLKGDECLMKVANKLIEIAQKHNVFVARYGGEEFIAIDVKNGKNKIKEVANDFVRSIESLNLQHEASIYHHLTLSAGFVHIQNCDAQNYIQLINYADAALYEAKKNGRNQSKEFKNVA